MDIFSLLEELRAIAQNGVHFATDPYDRERYERLMSLTTRTYSRLLDLPGETLRARFSCEAGCTTPKVGAGAAIFNAAGACPAAGSSPTKNPSRPSSARCAKRPGWRSRSVHWSACSPAGPACLASSSVQCLRYNAAMGHLLAPH